MQHLESLRMPLERVYSFPFDAFDSVNTAVWYVLCLAQPNRRHQPEEHRGRARYRVEYNNVLADLYVLHATPLTTIVRIHPLAPSDPIQAMLWRKLEHVGAAVGAFLELLKTIDEQLNSLLGQAAKAEGYIPPPPATTEQIITWWHLYHPEKTAPQIVLLIEQLDGRRIPERTLYNKSSLQIAAGAPKGNKRGRKPRNR
jgi:hypothetical protein